MDAYNLKTYIYDNKYVEQLLESIGCHHIVYHPSKSYWSCGNPDGDNKSAIIIYDTEFLGCIDYTRSLIKGDRSTDIIDLICFFKDLTFPLGLKYICENIGLSYYHDFEADIPESLKILQLLDEMGSTSLQENDNQPLEPIDNAILDYYLPYVNDVFNEDGIDYDTQKDFGIGFDDSTDRITIPIYSEVGDLVGIKGRYLYREVPDGINKYTYLEPCSKSKILFGYNKTMPYVKEKGIVYVGEAEKFVMQLWSYGDRCAVSTGGKKISKYQIDMLVRSEAKIVLCFDKDVTLEEIEDILDLFPEGVPVYYMYDENNKLLEEKESPSDSYATWKYLKENNIYKGR